MSIYLTSSDLDLSVDDDLSGPFGTGPAIDDLEPLYDPNFDSFFDDALFDSPFGQRRSASVDYSPMDEGWPYPDEG